MVVSREGPEETSFRWRDHDGAGSSDTSSVSLTRTDSPPHILPPLTASFHLSLRSYTSRLVQSPLRPSNSRPYQLANPHRPPQQPQASWQGQGVRPAFEHGAFPLPSFSLSFSLYEQVAALNTECDALVQVLENVKEMWFVSFPHLSQAAELPRSRLPVSNRTEAPKGKGKKPVNKDRFVSKMCTLFSSSSLRYLSSILTTLPTFSRLPMKQSCEETRLCLVSFSPSLPVFRAQSDLPLPRRSSQEYLKSTFCFSPAVPFFPSTTTVTHLRCTAKIIPSPSFHLFRFDEIGERWKRLGREKRIDGRNVIQAKLAAC